MDHLFRCHHARILSSSSRLYSNSQIWLMLAPKPCLRPCRLKEHWHGAAPATLTFRKAEKRFSKWRKVLKNESLPPHLQVHSARVIGSSCEVWGWWRVGFAWPRRSCGLQRAKINRAISHRFLPMGCSEVNCFPVQNTLEYPDPGVQLRVCPKLLHVSSSVAQENKTNENVVHCRRQHARRALPPHMTARRDVVLVYQSQVHCDLESHLPYTSSARSEHKRCLAVLRFNTWKQRLVRPTLKRDSMFVQQDSRKSFWDYLCGSRCNES
eukprot:756156-Amphidinium_carterae.1